VTSSPIDTIREALTEASVVLDLQGRPVQSRECYDALAALTEVEQQLADQPITTQQHHLLLIEIRDLTAERDRLQAILTTRSLSTTENERLERINRAFEFVPHNLYDEITKLAENALGEFIRERDELADALRKIQQASTVANARDLARWALDRHTPKEET
jgi:hypothetical protein